MTPHASPPLVMLAAGGTGGHLFPAEALARELLKRGLTVCLMTDRRGGRFSAEMEGIPAYRVRASGLGRSLAGKLRGVINMIVGTLQAWNRIRQFQPALVVGFGGYPSVPTVFAASRLGVPIILHEQNAVAGRANRVLAPLARAAAIGFAHVKGLEKTRNVMTGNPVRPAICALHNHPYPEVTERGPVRILVMGGSLGATVFSNVVPKAIKLLPSTLRQRIVIHQQCRQSDIAAVQQFYAENGVQAELATFFHDVPDRLSACHLVICRSGASTVAELAASGRPAILVPYPHAVTGEQKANAEALAQAGGAWLIPEDSFTPEALAMRLESLLATPATLSRASSAVKALARINAAQKLADLACDIIGISQDGPKEPYNASGTNHTGDTAAA